MVNFYLNPVKKITTPTLDGWNKEIFGEVENFHCAGAKLTTLICNPPIPSKVNNFNCSDNLLPNFDGCPIEVNCFECYNNPTLTTYKYIPKIINFVYCDWLKDIPMLSLLKFKTHVFENVDFYDIFYRFTIYKNKDSYKKRILDCQKELINNGFAGNAGIE